MSNKCKENASFFNNNTCQQVGGDTKKGISGKADTNGSGASIILLQLHKERTM